MSHARTRVGWLADRPGNPGGAELTQLEFIRAAPQGVEVIDCPPGDIAEAERYREKCDVFVIHNCVQYTVEDLALIEGRPTLKFWHDVGPWVQDGVREWLNEHATQVCCSPIQASYMGLDGVPCIPPPVDLSRFSDAGARSNGNRKGTVSVGSWRNYGKAPHKAAEWAGSGGIDFYGGGPLAPPESKEVAYEAMPELLASYTTFVHLPTVIEPFGRVVAEAYAAGCEIVTNRLVGALYWLEEDPDAIGTAGEDFWKLVADA